MREIVSLQLGNLSNYAATHFWNVQESYFTYSETEGDPLIDHDIHWRAGIGADGSDTFLPRTVIYDLKGGFGPLRKVNALYDVGAVGGDATDDSLWSGKPSIQKQTPLELSSYQKSLDAGTRPSRLTPSSVRYWSDYSRVFFHPRSLVPLYDYELHSTMMPFERFEMGSELFRSLDRDDDIVDRDWRPFVEECDQMQGVQVFTTLDDAWGGFAGAYLEALRDQHPKTCIWVWGLQTPAAAEVPREKRRLRSANLAQSLHHMHAQASMVVPLAAPRRLPAAVDLDLDLASPWSSSALFAAAAETCLLPSRTHLGSSTPFASLSELARGLNVAGNQTLASMRMQLSSQSGDGSGGSNNDDDHHHDWLDVDLSRFGHLGEQSTKDDGRGGDRFFGRVETVRAAHREGKLGDGNGNVQDEPRRPVIGTAVSQSYSLPIDFPLLDSFPSIFTQPADQGVMRVRTAVSTDKSLPARLKQLGTQAAWAVPADHRETLLNGLAEMGDAYHDDWSSGSDLDDDDM